MKPMTCTGQKCFWPRWYNLTALKAQRVDHNLDTTCPLCVDIRDETGCKLALQWHVLDCNSIEIISECSIAVKVTIGVCEKNPKKKMWCSSWCGSSSPCTCAGHQAHTHW